MFYHKGNNELIATTFLTNTYYTVIDPIALTETSNVNTSGTGIYHMTEIPSSGFIILGIGGASIDVFNGAHVL
jgi:hypothetical protein